MNKYKQVIDGVFGEGATEKAVLGIFKLSQSSAGQAVMKAAVNTKGAIDFYSPKAQHAVRAYATADTARLAEHVFPDIEAKYPSSRQWLTRLATRVNPVQDVLGAKSVSLTAKACGKFASKINTTHPAFPEMNAAFDTLYTASAQYAAKQRDFYGAVAQAVLATMEENNASLDHVVTQSQYMDEVMQRVFGWKGMAVKHFGSVVGLEYDLVTSIRKIQDIGKRLEREVEGMDSRPYTNWSEWSHLPTEKAAQALHDKTQEYRMGEIDRVFSFGF